MTNEPEIVSIFRRRADRQRVEMIAHLRHDARTISVMLKDLTRNGAQINCTTKLNVDEAISLALPGYRPSLAFVAWSKDNCAGLEFAEPLQLEKFNLLVEAHALGSQLKNYQIAPLAA